MASPTSFVPDLPRESDGFRLERELGRGGMGVVYEAVELGSGRRVALKILSEELAFSDEAFRRFRREARLAAGIGDPRCVFVLGAHRVEGAPAIAMELVDGGTLQHRISSGEAISVDQAVRWTIDVVDGLMAAHAQGVLHRDIKPSNCFVDAEGRVKLGDFGLSRAIERDVNLTQSGQFIGSPLYAAPEQVKGRGLDERSDQYSVGALLYALLAGRAPHTGSNVGEVLARILSENPAPPSTVRAGVPRALDKVVLRALSREPDKRFKDMAALREALLPFVDRDTPPEHLAGRFGAFLVDQLVLMFVGTLAGLSAENFLPDSLRAFLETDGHILLVVLGFAPVLLYYGTLEGAGGLTVGRWIVGSRVVDFASRQATYKGAYLRALIFFAPGVLVQLALAISGWSELVAGAVGSLTSLVWWLVLFLPARAHNGWRGRHERWSGTRTDQVRPPLLRSAPASVPKSSPIPFTGSATLGAYTVLGSVQGHEGVLEARDEELGRDVWIVPASAGDGLHRTRSRSTKLRWLDSVRVDDAEWSVYEAPGGSAPLAARSWLADRDWTQRSRLAAQLLDEAAAAQAAGEAGPLGPETLWVDRHGNLRVLDHHLDRALQAAPGETERCAQLAASMRALYLDADARRQLPVDLPVHAEPVVRALLQPQPSLAGLRQVRANLARALGGAQRPSTRQRLLQLALGFVLPFGLLGSVALGVGVAVLYAGSAGVEAQVALKELREDRAELAPESIDDRRLILWDAARSPWSNLLLPEPSQQRQVEEELDAWGAARPARLERERLELAHQRFGAQHPTIEQHRDSGLVSRNSPAILPLSAAALLLVWTAAATIGAFLTRGGIAFWTFGLRLRDRRGRPAPRWLCATRALLLGSVPALLLGASAWLVEAGPAWAGWTLGAAVVAGGLALLATAAVRTAAGPVDKLLGTRIVPV